MLPWYTRIIVDHVSSSDIMGTNPVQILWNTFPQTHFLLIRNKDYMYFDIWHSTQHWSLLRWWSIISDWCCHNSTCVGTEDLFDDNTDTSSVSTAPATIKKVKLISILHKTIDRILSFQGSTQKYSLIKMKNLLFHLFLHTVEFSWSSGSIW